MSNKFTPVPSPATTRDNLVTIEVEADFPTPSAGVITLADDTQYLIVKDISTANRFVLGDNMVMCAPDSSIVALTYTGTGAMFTSTGAKTNKVESITLSCASGSLLDITGTGAVAGVFQLLGVTVTACDTIGTINAMGNVILGTINFLNIVTDGVIFTGANGSFFTEKLLSIIATGSVFDLGTATFANAFSAINSSATVAAGAFFLSGATASANIASGGLGTILNTRFSGAGTFLSGISIDDARWKFLANDEVADTHTHGLLSLTGAPTTTIAAVNTPVLIAGTWIIEKTSQFTGTAAGRLTWDGERTIGISIDVTTTIESVSGSNKDISVYVAKNGAIDTSSVITNRVSSNDPKNSVNVWDLTLAPTDFVEVFVENNTDSINLVVNNAVLRIS